MTDWEGEWRAAHERSPLRITPQNAERWREFWSLDAEYYLNEVKAEAVLYDKVVDRLVDEGWALPSDQVLDVGSGPGTLALPLSRRVGSIYALDEAEGMLETLHEECAVRGISNVATIHHSWKDYKGGGEFDLVLASLSPAIRCAEDLLAMERASRDRCCLITACPSDWMSLRNDLWNLVIGEFAPSDAYSSRYPLNILRERGRRTETYRATAEVDMSRPSKDVIDHYVRYFGIFIEMTADKAGAIRDHVLSGSKDGMFRSAGSKCLELICWRK